MIYLGCLQTLLIITIVGILFHDLPGLSADDIDYYTDYETLEDLHFAVKNNQYVSASSVDSWYYSYRSWLNSSSDPAVTALIDPSESVYLWI